MRRHEASSGRRRKGQQILPIIYFQPQPKANRLVSSLLICSCGFWIFVLGALIERLPQGRELPNIVLLSSAPTFSSSTTTTTTTSSPPGATARSAVNVLNSNSTSTNDIFNQSHQLEPARSTEDHPYFGFKNNVEILKRSPSKRSDEDQQTIRSNDHIHKIPNVLIFTHAFNLLRYEYQVPNNTDTSAGSNENSDTDAIEKQQELLALKENVQHTIDLHPNAQVRFLTDKECIISLEQMLGPDAPLIRYFQTETTGMYKADICRGAALWESGGLYLDVDVGVRMSLWDVLSHETTFATSLVHRQSLHVGNFFQAFMAVTPRHVILERYMQLFEDYYQGNLTRPIKKGPLGVILLRQAFDDVANIHPTEGDHHSGKNDDEYFQLGPKTLHTASGKMEIWQEVQYSSKFFPNLKPAPTWGTRRACHFVVVSNRKFPLVVPLYSRIAGSRMCRGGTQDNKTKHNKEKHHHHHDHNVSETSAAQ